MIKRKLQDGELYIDDNKQLKEVYEQYKKYYNKDKFTITNDGNKISSL